MLTELVSQNKIDWDEHLFIVLFSYIIAYKIATWYTPYQLVYGLHPLMPTKYIIPVVGRDEKYITLMKVLTSRITELEKLLEAKMQAIETVGIQLWNKTLWSQQKNPKK
jgi:hypothetical protein